MGKRSSASTLRGWRYIRPRYYLKRPRRLAFMFIAFVSFLWIVYDRQTLNREHQEEIFRLKEEVTRLQAALENMKVKDSRVNIGSGHIIQKITESNSIQDDPINTQRRENVREAMLHAWTSYEKYAWGQDELQPQSKDGVDSFGGLGATLVDSLDTLFIMGLEAQFQRARQWIATSLNFSKDIEVSVFETTIRLN